VICLGSFLYPIMFTYAFRICFGSLQITQGLSGSPVRLLLLFVAYLINRNKNFKSRFAVNLILTLTIAKNQIEATEGALMAIH
jgi:hypothetical protein